jgi:hypothetical protein
MDINDDKNHTLMVLFLVFDPFFFMDLGPPLIVKRLSLMKSKSRSPSPMAISKTTIFSLY